MAFIPRPVNPSPGDEEDDEPSSPASFNVGSPTEKRAVSFYSIDSRTGLVTFKNGGERSEEPLSSDGSPSPVYSAHGETVNVGPPHLWHSFPSPNPMPSNVTSTYGGTTSTRSARADVVSEPLRVDTAYRNPFGGPSPVSVYSRASMTKFGAGRENTYIAGDKPNPSSAFSELKHDALSPVPLLNSPPPVSSPRDRATDYTPTLYSILNHYNFPESPVDHSQREQEYSDSARKATPSVYSFHSSAASVHSMWAESTPHILPPLVLAPDIAHFRGFSSYFGPTDPSPGNNTSFTARGSIAPLRPKRKFSEPGRTLQRYGDLSAHQSCIPPVKESHFSRRGSDGPVLDEPQWWRLVFSAAAKP